MIIGCSILGNPTYSIEWKTVAGVLEAIYIEDNCESLGASLPNLNKLTGTQGLMNSFSLFYSHQLSAIEGGIVLTDDDECATVCKILRAHGWTRDVKKPTSFDDEYNFVAAGYNLRALEMHAAIAREQLKKLSRFLEQRRVHSLKFRKWTDHLNITHPIFCGNPSPFGLHFTLKDAETRLRVVKALRENGIDCRLPTGGSFRLHKIGEKWRNQETPNADRIHKTGLFLGNSPYDISPQIAKAVEVMNEVL